MAKCVQERGLGSTRVSNILGFPNSEKQPAASDMISAGDQEFWVGVARRDGPSCGPGSGRGPIMITDQGEGYAASGVG